MTKHSCDHNIVIIFKDQYLIIRASRDIAENEEIFSCYGPYYTKTSIEERQKALSSQYYFTCKCKRCTHPNLKYFLDRFTAMNCLKCNGALCIIENSLVCLDCFDKPKHFQQDQIEQAEKLYNEAESHIVRKNFKAAFKKLEKSLNIRRKTLYKHNEDTVSTLNLLAKLYIKEGKLADWQKCWESSIDADIERLGPSSPELLDKLYTRTILCIGYLQNMSNPTTSSYEDLLTITYKYLKRVEELADLNYGSWSDVYKQITMIRHKIFSITCLH